MSVRYADPPNSFDFIRCEIKNEELAAFFKKIGMTSFNIYYEESDEEDYEDEDENYLDEDEYYEGEHIVSAEIDLETGMFKFSSRESGYTEHFGAVIDAYNNYELPFITPWLMTKLIYSMSLSGREAEFVSKWNQAQDEHKLGAWDDRWFQRKEIQEFFQAMDASISEGFVEWNSGSDMIDTNFCSFTEIINGRKYTAKYFDKHGTKHENGDEVGFVVSGELKHFENRDKIVEAIKKIGGIVSDDVTEDTDFLICNDLHCGCAEIIKAADAGVRILSEAAFIRIFSVDGYSDRICPKDCLFSDVWDVPWEYDARELIRNEGLAAVEAETWQDGRWVNNKRS